MTVQPNTDAAEKSKVALKEVMDKLEQGVKDVFSSEAYADYLKTMSRFHNYSPNNSLLIFMQNPQASLVAGYQAWQNNFDRHVKKGEKGIKIIAPVPYKYKTEVEKIGADGKPYKEQTEVTGANFRAISVFDVSQTDGAPLPEHIHALQGDVPDYNLLFEAAKQSSPCPVTFGDMPRHTIRGFYDHSENRIVLREGMRQMQTLKTLMHEMAHAKLHKRSDEALPDRRTREVEAESIAYTVCQHYGLDTSDYSFKYIANWSADKDLKELRGSLNTIQAAAHDIISSVDERVQELIVERNYTLPKANELNTLFELEQFCKEHGHTDFLNDIKNSPQYAEFINNESLMNSLVLGSPFAYVSPAEKERDASFVERLKGENTVIVENFKRDLLEQINKTKTIAHRAPEQIAAEIPQPEYLIEPEKLAMRIRSIYSDIKNANPEKVAGGDALNMAVKRLQALNKEIPDTENAALCKQIKCVSEKYAPANGEENLIPDTLPTDGIAAIKDMLNQDFEELSRAVEDYLKVQIQSDLAQTATTGDTFSIYQLKDSGETRAYRWQSLDVIERSGLAVDIQNYDSVYTASLDVAADTLGSIHDRFNIDKPLDFKGHSLSVSDVIVLNINGEDFAHYVDSVGFQALPEFWDSQTPPAPEISQLVAERETRRSANEKSSKNTAGINERIKAAKAESQRRASDATPHPEHHKTPQRHAVNI